MPLSSIARPNQAGPNWVGITERWEIGSDGAIDTASTVPQAQPVTRLGSACGLVPDSGHCHRGVHRTLGVMHQRRSGRLVGRQASPTGA